MRPSSLLLLIFVSASLHAAAESPLTLADALARVEAGHPFLRTRDAESRLAAARSASAAARPAAEISLQLENALGTGALSAARSLETTLQLSRALDLADRRTARATVATARNDAEHLVWQERRRELHAEAACRFIRVVAAQARYAALTRWRDAQERLARRESARGEVRWSAGLRRVESTDNFGFVFGLGYSLPNRASGEASASEARAERERTVADGEAALHAVRATLFSLYQELGHARLAHDTARDELIPAATAWLAAIDAGLAAGRYHARDQLEARAALFSARRRQVQAAADYHATLVEVEHLLAAPASS
jgi:cobalt-zinc-cadmium efflux system outer membrane protein